MDFGNIKQKRSARHLSIQHQLVSRLSGRVLARQLEALRQANAMPEKPQPRTYIRSIGGEQIVGR